MEEFTMTEKECQFGHCKHGVEYHINGSCYAVTEPDKTGVEQFCKCDSQHGHNQRLYPDLQERGLGIQEQAEDFLVTKKCIQCKDDVLLRREETHCMSCKA